MTMQTRLPVVFTEMHRQGRIAAGQIDASGHAHMHVVRTPRARLNH